ESDALYARWAIPAPGRPLFEAAAANFSLHSPAKVDTGNAERGPLLLSPGGPADRDAGQLASDATVSGAPDRRAFFPSGPARDLPGRASRSGQGREPRMMPMGFLG